MLTEKNNMKKILTENGLVDEGFWDKAKQWGGRAINAAAQGIQAYNDYNLYKGAGYDPNTAVHQAIGSPIFRNVNQQIQQQGQQQNPQAQGNPQPQNPQQQNKVKAANDLAKKFNIQPSKLMQMIQSGNIPGISPDTMQKLKTFFVGDQPQQQAKPVEAPPVIGQQPTTPAAQAVPQQQAQPTTSPTTQQSQQATGDPFQNLSVGRIQTTEPSLRMMPQQKLQMAPQSGEQPLRMMPQQPLPGEQQPQQAVPRQQTQPQAQPQQQKRVVTPAGAAAARWSKKYVPRGRVGTYKLEETLSEDQLKALIKEVAKVLKKL